MTGIITTEYLPDGKLWKAIITYPNMLHTYITGCESKTKAKQAAAVMLRHYRKTTTVRIIR